MPVDFDDLTTYMNISLHISRSKHFTFEFKLYTHTHTHTLQLASGWFPEVLTSLKALLYLNSPREEQRVPSHFTLEHLPFPWKEKKKLLEFAISAAVHWLSAGRGVCILYESMSTCVTVSVGQCRAQLLSLISRMRSNHQDSNFNSKCPITNSYLYFSRLVWDIHDILFILYLFFFYAKWWII